MNKPPTKRTRPLPSLTLGREIAGTLYVVYGEYSPDTSEDAGQKIKRLLLKEIEAKRPKTVDIAMFALDLPAGL